MSLHHNPRIITDGLVLCLDAANTKSYPGSGTTWTDLTGRGNNGTLNNGPTFNSSNNGSIVFDGINDYGQTATAALPSSATSPMTLEAACMTTNTGLSYQTVLGTNGIYTQIGFSYSYFAGGRNGGGGNTLYTGLTSISANTWYHMILSFDGTNGKFYLNGNLIYTGSIGSNGGTNGVHLLSTYAANTAAERFEGRIAIARVYNTALSADQVSQNFQALRGRYGI